MKNLICSLGLILMGVICQAQTFPITTNQGSTSTLNKALGGLTAGVGFINTTYTDTISANLNSYIKHYPGAQIFTTSNGKFWIRNYATTQWMQVYTAGTLPYGDTTAWSLNGNDVSQMYAQPFLGTQSDNDLNIITNSLVRLIVPNNGIVRSSAARNKVLTIDTVSHGLYYTDGGSSVNIYNSDGVLTGDRSLDAFNHDLSFTDVKEMTLAVTGDAPNHINITAAEYVDLHTSAIRVYADSLRFEPNLGDLVIDTLLSQHNASDSMMVWAKSGTNAGKVGYRPIPISSGGTVTSVATGYGLSGGTITTTGTLIADTSILVNKTGVQTITNKTINGANNSLTVRLANDVTGVLPITNGGTNNGSLSVTNGNLYYGDGTKLVGLGIGTTKQTLHVVAGIPAWVDTAATAAQVYPGAGIANSTGSAWGTSYTTTGSGTVVALQTSPTFVTNITSPLIIGGTGTTSSLTYKTTTGVGTTGADHIFQVGNNGATEAMRILNNGNVGINTASPGAKLQVNVNGSTGALYRGENASYTNSSTNIYGGGTAVAGTNTVYQVSQWGSSSGGAVFIGTSSGGSVPAMVTYGITNSSPSSQPPLLFTAAKNDGSTGVTPIGSSELLLQIENASTGGPGGGTKVLTILGGGNLGIGTTSPTSLLHTAGSFSTGYIAKTANYTATISDHTIEATTGTFTVTLPTAVGVTGRIYVITNSGTGVVTVGTTASQVFRNVSGTPTTLTLNQFSTVTVQSNGSDWLRITSL